MHFNEKTGKGILNHLLIFCLESYKIPFYIVGKATNMAPIYLVK